MLRGLSIFFFGRGFRRIADGRATKPTNPQKYPSDFDERAERKPSRVLSYLYSVGKFDEGAFVYVQMGTLRTVKRIVVNIDQTNVPIHISVL